MASPSTKDWIAREPKILAQKSANFMKKALVKDGKGDEAPSGLSQVESTTGVEFGIPDALLKGTDMTKVSGSGHKKKIFQLDPDEGRILYNKSGKIGVVPIESIKEIRTGSDARYDRTQFKLPEAVEARWITLIYILEGTYKTLHLIAETHGVLAMWDTALRKLLAVRRGLMSGLGNTETRQAVWERQYWKGADRKGNQKLDLEEVEMLCKRLNARLDAKELRRLFSAADTKAQGFLGFGEFQAFVKLLKRRPEVEALYEQLCNGNSGKMDFVAFQKFMRDTQKSNVTQDQLEVIFARYASPSPVSNAQMAESEASALPAPEASSLTLDGFSNFLLSLDNTPFSESRAEVWHDMSQPISSYFISTSHNTYLVGNQLIGVSTVEGYIRALLHGCRSVELDIYDGDSSVGPVVFHGLTLTSSVPMRDICVAIAKYAFATSPFPILISAEIHCSLEQQDVLVQIMRDVFGDTLICAPIEGREQIEQLPSPEDLKGKVLLKAKNLFVAAELEALRKRSGSASKKAALEVERPPSPTSSAEESDTDSGKLGKLKATWKHVRHRPQSTSAPKMSLNLAALTVYTVGVRCLGLKPDSGIKYAPEHLFSLSEATALKILKGHASTGGMRDLIEHTQEHLVRIYPIGTRVDSTNYTPHKMWAAGAQLVAINWQTFDLGYTINQTMFQRNGRSGYVLKPAALREGGEKLLSKHTKHVLDITIISAQQLPLPKNSRGEEMVEKSAMDPFVQVHIHIPDWTHAPFISSSSDDPPSLTSAREARTVSSQSKAVKSNGFNPVWQETLSLEFDCVGDMSELVFLHFVVRQEGGPEDENLAMYCTPLGCLGSGYRHLPLHDAQLTQYLFSTLFVKIDVRDV